MDTSKEFILMCGKAPELPLTRSNHYFGDFIYYDGIVMVVNGFALNEDGNEYRAIWNIDDAFNEQWFTECLSQTVWLPSQDQLQQILFAQQAAFGNDHTEFKFVVTYNSKGDVCLIGDDEGDVAGSIEQYLLKNVMFYCYDKIWKDGNWIIKSENR